jgi:hypothetical protein
MTSISLDFFKPIVYIKFALFGLNSNTPGFVEIYDLFIHISKNDLRWETFDV